MLKILKANLFLFDGEAAGTAGEGVSTEAQGVDGGHKPTIENPNIPLHLLRNKPKSLENQGAKSGGDNTAEGDATSQAEPTYEEFKERFKENIDKDFKAHLNRRFKTVNSENETLKKSNTAMQEVLNLVGNKYPGVDVNNPEALLAAMRSDESFFRKKALENGTSVEEEQFTYAKDAELKDARKRLATIEAEREQQKTLAEISRQGEELKGTYPDFSIESAMENETFRRMLAFTKAATGVENVKDAYEFAFRDQLREQAIKQTVDKTKEAMSQQRKAKQFMPSPPGTTGKAAGNDTSIVQRMGVKEFAKLASQGKNLADFL